MDAYTKWAKKPETEAKIASAKQSAWADFTKQFPNADKTKFVAQTDVDNKWNITVEIFFKEGPDSLQSVFGSDRKYWSQKMKTALGLAGVGGFPCQLSPLKTKNALPIPSVDFAEPAPSLKNIFNNSTKIYVTPDSFFVTKFREIFQKTKPRHNSAPEAKRWLHCPINQGLLTLETCCGYEYDRTRNEPLAAAAKLRRILRHARLWNLTRNL